MAAETVPVSRPARSGGLLNGSGIRFLALPPLALLAIGLGVPLVAIFVSGIRAYGIGGLFTHPVHDTLFVHAAVKTLWLSALITAITWVVGLVFTLALGLAPPRLGKALFAILFLTFWISLLVRTYGWVLTLQPAGALSSVLPSGANIYQTLPGLLPPMVHVMLPYMVLPMYTGLQNIDPAQLRAARSLGAGEMLTLRRVVVPALVPGSVAGAVLVFVLSLGFYVTPAFLGGPSDQLVAIVIGTQLGRGQSLAGTATMGALLLIVVLALYFIADRWLGIGKQWGRT
jgi:ABC-type spermidine/putrescine transport system permease subunit I